MSEPNAVHIYVGTRISLLREAGIRRLLDAFDREPALVPTHWGNDESDRRDYDRHHVLDRVRAFSSGDYVLSLRRSKPPRYSAYLNALRARRHPKGLCHVRVTFPAKIAQRHLEPVFRLGEALAANLETEYGLVHPIWQLGEASQRYSETGLVRFADLQDYGPPGVAARTWFGPHLADLFGRDLLSGLDVPTGETAWGGVAISLVEEPWSAGFEALRARQEAVMAALGPAGVFGRYEGFDMAPGDRWVPIPETEAS